MQLQVRITLYPLFNIPKRNTQIMHEKIQLKMLLRFLFTNKDNDNSNDIPAHNGGEVRNEKVLVQVLPIVTNELRWNVLKVSSEHSIL